MIHLKLSSDNLDEINNDLALIFAYEDKRPLQGQAGMLDWRLNGALSQIILKEKFNGYLGEALLMPSRGRVATRELLILGLGHSENVKDQYLPQYIQLILDPLLKKNTRSFCLSLSDLVPGMFEWRNTVRHFVSALTGLSDNYHISLFEPEKYIEDARKRNMDFAYNVQVQYS